MVKAKNKQIRTPAQIYALLRQPLKAWLTEHFDRFASVLDDAMFMHAEQSSDYRVQQEYAAAIRTLRFQRTGLVRDFKAMVLQACETQLLDPAHYDLKYAWYPAASSEKTSRQQIELLDQEVFEEELVVLRVSQSAQNRYATVLNELGGMLFSVLPSADFKSERLPFSPVVLTGIFLHQLRDWQYDAGVKLFACEVFANDFLTHCDTLYANLNHLLQESGLRSTVMVKKYRQAGFDYTQAPSNDRLDSATLFGAVVMMRQLGIKQRTRLGLPSQYLQVRTETAAASHLQMKNGITQLMQQLQQLQAEKPPQDLLQARQSQINSLRGLEQEVSEKHYPVRTLDVQIIDVISMLFNFILDDPVLPARMKVLLVRLQMPVLRVAVEDKSFLTDRAHPARVLLNNFSQAAVKCAESGDLGANHIDAVIEEMIQRILEKFAGNVELFKQINSEFEAFLSHEERSAKVVEDRLIETAKGREQLLLARQRVYQKLKQMLPKQIAESAYVLIKEAWCDVMTLTLLREGENSLAWQKVVDICERLIDSVIPKAQPAARRKRMLEIPGLLNELRKGIAAISFDNTKANQLLARLQRCHIVCLRGLPPERVVTVSETIFADEKDEELLDDEFSQIAKRLQPGQWLAWRTSEGKERRGKLAWKSRRVDILLLVDSRGRKLGEMTSVELADYFRKGNAIVLTRIDEPLMERALQSIYNVLLPGVGKPVVPA